MLMVRPLVTESSVQIACQFVSLLSHLRLSRQQIVYRRTMPLAARSCSYAAGVQRIGNRLIALRTAGLDLFDDRQRVRSKCTRSVAALSGRAPSPVDWPHHVFWPAGHLPRFSAAAVPVYVRIPGVAGAQCKVVAVEIRSTEAHRNDWFGHVVAGQLAKLSLEGFCTSSVKVP